jgi:hypothetical protein
VLFCATSKFKISSKIDFWKTELRFFSSGRLKALDALRRWGAHVFKLQKPIASYPETELKLKQWTVF